MTTYHRVGKKRNQKCENGRERAYDMNEFKRKIIESVQKKLLHHNYNNHCNY